MRKNLRRLLIIPILLVGALALFLMTKGRGDPPRTDAGERAVPVRTLTVQPLTVHPHATGYGRVRPAQVWSATAEVTGRVVAVADDLQAGRPVRAGSLLIRIDETDYRLALRQAQANIRVATAQLEQLKVQEANLRASLAIEEQALASSARDLERNRRLAKQGLVPSNALEAQERAHLAQLQKVQGQRSSLNLLPSDRAVKEAQLAQFKAQVRQAERNLERVRIVAPFNARLAEVNVVQDQYVRQGEVLAVLDGMEQAEVEAHVTLEQFAQLVPHIDVGAMIRAEQRPGPQAFGIRPLVRMRVGTRDVMWPARLVRTTAGVDPQTATVGVVVAVDGPYATARPPLRPPLAKGLYVAVELWGGARPEQVAIPRIALHEDAVYVVDADNRLRRRAVAVGLRQSGFVTVEAGLLPGERIVAADIVPAIEGMLLAPTPDEDAAAALAAAVAAPADLAP